MMDLKRRRLKLALTIAFALAIVMGPGPGIYLINLLFGIMLVALAGRALYPPEMTAAGMVPHPHVGEFDQIVIVMIKEQLPALLGALGVVVNTLVFVLVSRFTRPLDPKRVESFAGDLESEPGEETHPKES